MTGPATDGWTDLGEFARRRRLFAITRLGALERIGDPVLVSLVRLARTVTGASSAAVHIFDEHHQRSLATAGTPMAVVPAEDTFCRLVVEQGTRIITTDATADQRFAYSSFANGAAPVRFYAGLPLTVEGETTVGTLCAFDTEAMELTEPQLASLEDISLLVRAHLELMHIATDLGREASQDGLTGVTTRVLFDGVVGRALADRNRHGEDVMVALIDIDNFKQINDTHGHGVGDDALRWVGARLSELVSPEGTVGRLGGDEFAVIARANHADAEALLNRIRQASDGFVPEFRISVGSTFAEDDDDVSSLLRRADRRMYAIKAARGGPNRRNLYG